MACRCRPVSQARLAQSSVPPRTTGTTAVLLVLSLRTGFPAGPDTLAGPAQDGPDTTFTLGAARASDGQVVPEATGPHSLPSPWAVSPFSTHPQPPRTSPFTVKPLPEENDKNLNPKRWG